MEREGRALVAAVNLCDTEAEKIWQNLRYEEPEPPNTDRIVSILQDVNVVQKQVEQIRSNKKRGKGNAGFDAEKHEYW
jgi:hypothetical protein